MEGRNRFHQQQRRRHQCEAMEERIVGQHREIQALVLENQRLAATHVALKDELLGCEQELRHISSAASQVKADRDAEVREVYERSLKMEADAAAVNEVREETHKLNAVKMELSSSLQDINNDLVRVRARLHHSSTIKADIQNLHHEIQKGRDAIELEKKTRAENLEHEQAMEKNMVSMAHELEKLRAELADAEKRARAAAAAAAANSGPGYAGSYGTPEMGYGRNSYMDTFGMHQVQGAEGSFQYASATASHGAYDMQQAHVHR